MSKKVIFLSLILISATHISSEISAQDSTNVTLRSENAETDEEAPRVGLTDLLAGKIIRFAPLGTLLIYFFQAFIFVRCLGAFLYYTLWDLKKDINNENDLDSLINKKSLISPLVQGVVDRCKETSDIQALKEKAEEIRDIVFDRLEGKIGSFNMGNHAPLLGFLGTVIGMIVTFEQVSKAPAGQFTPADLANGISTALVTTALGLIVKLAVDFMKNNVTRQVDILRDEIYMFSHNIPYKVLQGYKKQKK